MVLYVTLTKSHVRQMFCICAWSTVAQIFTALKKSPLVVMKPLFSHRCCAVILCTSRCILPEKNLNLRFTYQLLLFFRPKHAVEHKINCLPSGYGPIKPANLISLEQESTKLKHLEFMVRFLFSNFFERLIRKDRKSSYYKFL